MEFLRSYKRLQRITNKEEKAKKEGKCQVADSEQKEAEREPVAVTEDDILFQQLEKVINEKVVERIPSPRPKEVLSANESSKESSDDDDDDDDEGKESEHATSCAERRQSPKNKSPSLDGSDDYSSRKISQSLGSLEIEEEQSTSDFEVIDDTSSDSVLSFLPQIPDRSKSDYYCEVCDCHMNNMQMWESHISGKRHIKNMRKPPGELPSKVRTVKQDNATPLLQSKINRIQEPVVGLSYVCEYQRAEKHVSPLYTCYLCHGTMGKTQTLEHIVSAKHRFNFLKEVDPEGADVIKSMALKKETKESLISGKAADWEAKHGREQMEVRMEVKRSAPLPTSLHKKVKLCHSAEEEKVADYREKSVINTVPYQHSPSPRPYRHHDIETDLPSSLGYEKKSMHQNRSPSPRAYRHHNIETDLPSSLGYEKKLMHRNRSPSPRPYRHHNIETDLPSSFGYEKKSMHQNRSPSPRPYRHHNIETDLPSSLGYEKKSMHQNRSPSPRPYRHHNIEMDLPSSLGYEKKLMHRNHSPSPRPYRHHNIETDLPSSFGYEKKSMHQNRSPSPRPYRHHNIETDLPSSLGYEKKSMHPNHSPSPRPYRHHDIETDLPSSLGYEKKSMHRNHSPSPRPYRHHDIETDLPSSLGFETMMPKEVQADEIISYIKKSSTRMKLRLLEELSHPPITSEHEARTTMHVINILNRLILQYKIRCLPRDLQAPLARELLAQKSLSVLDQSSIRSSLASGVLGGLGGGVDMSSVLGPSVTGISNINTVLSSLRDRFSVVGNQGISSSLIGSSLIGNTSVISSTVENRGLTPFLQETALLNDFERARVLRQSLTETPLLSTLSGSTPFHL